MTKLSAPPLTVQTPAVTDVKLTARPELAVAVSPAQVAEFEAAAEELAAEVHPWARLSLVGPMAMYDFVPNG